MQLQCCAPPSYLMAHIQELRIVIFMDSFESQGLFLRFSNVIYLISTIETRFLILYINNSLHLLGYLSADIICSEKRIVSRERSSRKTVCYEEQIMSKDKYPSIFLPRMEATVLIILQIFFVTRAVGIFGHVTFLDQSRASENI